MPNRADGSGDLTSVGPTGTRPLLAVATAATAWSRSNSLRTAAARRQLRDGSGVYDVAPIEHDDAVSDLQAGPAVSHEQGRPAAGAVAQSFVYSCFDNRVDSGRRVVEHQQPGLAQQSAGYGNPLALAAGEREPALSDDRVEAIR